MTFIYDICPVTKPRQTRSDVWKKRKCVLKYRAFADEVRAAGIQLPPSGASVVFHLPMPKSWSKKKRAAIVGQPHQQVPDVSNLLKALEDAVHSDDSHIWHYSGLAKRWGLKGRIELGGIPAGDSLTSRASALVSVGQENLAMGAHNGRKTEKKEG